MAHEARATALAHVEDRLGDLSRWTRAIWDLAEPAFREYRSAALYVDLLRAEGFDVEAGTGGMPTAFRARFGSGSPVVATYVEYDAVPGNSQAAVPREEPRPGTTRHAAGHTDPHSALGTGALGGALGAKAAMERHGLGGTLVVFGEPAEKVQGSKPVHAAKGYYDELDAAISFHPAYMAPYTNTVRLDTHCGAWASCVYTFEPDRPELWGGGSADSPIPEAHAAARAPGAIDAVCLMYSISKQLREHVLPHAGSWSMNEAILVAGQATADNLPPDVAQIQYSWRVPTLEMADRMAEALERNARHVAALTGCTATRRIVSRSRPGLPNHALTAATYASLAEAGPPVFGDEARAFGHALRASLGRAAVDEPLEPGMSALIAPEDAERALRRNLPEWQRNFTSDDYVEYTWHCPTARLYVGRCALAPDGSPYPGWVANAIGGHPPCIDPTVRTAARTVALTLVDLLTEPALLAAAQTEFAERTGGGIGGERWVAPLLPADFAPPIELRWPEYVETPRGRSWWIG
jgi:aminobenzoyl-glutamate utilization protein B